MLLFFTSARKRLYKRDLLRVLCEPNGARVRFVFQTKWIADNLVSCTPTALNDSPALIVFAENQAVKPGAPSEVHGLTLEKARYFPLRKARVLSVSVESRTAWTFDLVLEDFIDFAKEGVSDTFTSKVSELPARPDDPVRSKWVTDSVSQTTDELPVSDDWTQLAEYVVRLRGLSDSVLLRACSPGDTTAHVFPGTQYAGERALCCIDSGSRIELKLQIICGQHCHGSTRSDVVIESSVAQVHGPFTTQASGGHLDNYYINFHHALQAQETIALVQAVSPESNTPVPSPELMTILQIAEDKQLAQLLLHLFQRGRL